MTFDEPIPFQEAVDILRQKGLLPTTLSSRELAMLDAQIRRRALFSARMTRIEFLAELKRLTEALVSGLRSSEEGVFLSVPEAKAQLREMLEKLGWVTAVEDRGTIKDFFTDRRRQLIVETNMLDVMGAGRTVAETTAVSLDVNPGWELVRVAPRIEPRQNWPERWKAAGDLVDWDGALPIGNDDRMIALKTSPIWQALGDGAGGYTDTLGNPWEPFAWGSGKGRIQVSRAVCEKLGLILPGQVQQPDTSAIDLNRNVSTSLSKFDQELMAVFQNDPMFIADRDRLRLRVTNAARVLWAAINQRIYKRDHLGRFAEDGGALSDADNISRGEKAIRRALRRRRDVRRAMQVRGLGDVHFIWGTPGNIRRDYAGGFGISHLLAKHGEKDAMTLPRALVKGKIIRSNDPSKLEVRWDTFVAVLVKEKRSESWVLTAFEKKVAARNCFAGGVRSQVNGRGNILTPPYANEPSLVAARQVAVSSANIRPIRHALKEILSGLKEAA